MKNGYDRVSTFYDALSKLVFGQRLLRAQSWLLGAIPGNSNILIAGGGSGWILEAIAKEHPSGLTITYVDASAKMVALARKRDAAGNKVIFIAREIEKVPLGPASFNVVITPFFMDNFRAVTAAKIFDGLHQALKPAGLWLFTDFRDTDRFWQKALLKVMYLFFRLFCGIEATHMPDMVHLFEGNGYVLKNEQLFLGGFIESKTYQHPGSSAFSVPDSIDR